jgi:signal transduction histidine kinase/DNA-binding response OmpR family regulator
MSTLPKLLVADDRPENLQALEDLLRGCGAQILKAYSGKQALELLLDHEIALAIIDVQMSELDGFQLAELMRSLERTREIPLIFVTAGLHGQERVFQGYESGAVDFLVKPLDARILRGKVSVFLQLYRQKQLLAGRVIELERALSERRKAEKALAAVNQRLYALMDAVPVGVSFSDDPTCQRVTGNRACLAQFEVSAADNLSASATDAKAPGRQVRFLRDGKPITDAELPLQRAVAQGKEIAPVELEVELPSGRRWFAEASAAPIWEAEGKLLGGIAVTVDITERKHSEAALRRSEARLRLLSRIAGGLLASQDPQSVVEGLCREVMAHLDCHTFFNFLLDADGRTLRLNACDGIPEEERRKAQRLDCGVAVCGAVASTRQRIIVEDVSHSSDPRVDLIKSFGIQAYCCHPLIAGERVLGTLSFGTRTRTQFSADEIELMHTVADQVAIAMERVQSSQSLSAANAQLVEVDRRKNEFLAVLSHELRNPLAPIKNSLYILDRAAPGGEQARRAQQVIGRQVHQLANLVDDLLDITRISRNKIQLRVERLDLNEVVRRSAEDNRALFESNGIRLDLTIAPEAVFVKADTTRVAQMVGNLLQNAAKFARRGGRTGVTVASDGTDAMVQVVDDGVGMTPETTARLFQPFMQADESLDRSKGGLGLGLALVKGLVELHGGRISAHSDGLGKGARFEIRLPLDAGAPVEPNAASPAPARARCRILIVEDNVDAAESLREALEFDEHMVAVAHNGPDGLEQARSFKPDVVLCDIGLPGMDGYQVARAFRRDDALKGTFLVALSGYALPEDRERATEAGFQRHLAKPPSLASLEEILANLPTVIPG